MFGRIRVGSLFAIGMMLFVVLAGCLADQELGSAPGETGERIVMEGVITDAESGLAVPEAEVAVFEEENDDRLALDITNNDGEYSFSFLFDENDMPDDLRVEVAGDGYETYTEEVQVDEVIIHDIELTPIN